MRVPRRNDSPDNTINHCWESKEGDDLSDDMEVPVKSLIKKRFGGE
jgi:hypothetical protein